MHRLGNTRMLYPRGGNDRERRLESTCPLRHVCNASIAFFTVLFQRGEESTRRERETGRLSTFPRWNSRACAEPRQAEDEDVTRTTTGPLFFRVASFPRRCGRSLGIKFLGRSCDQVNMHFFFCPVHPPSASSSFVHLPLSPRRHHPPPSVVHLLFDFCTRISLIEASRKESKSGAFENLRPVK